MIIIKPIIDAVIIDWFGWLFVIITAGVFLATSHCKWDDLWWFGLSYILLSAPSPSLMIQCQMTFLRHNINALNLCELSYSCIYSKNGFHFCPGCLVSEPSWLSLWNSRANLVHLTYFCKKNHRLLPGSSLTHENNTFDSNRWTYFIVVLIMIQMNDYCWYCWPPSFSLMWLIVPNSSISLYILWHGIHLQPMMYWQHEIIKA